MLRGDLPRPAYVSLLFRLLGLHEPIEDRLAPHTNSVWLAWFVADRARRLRRDLQALGIPTGEIAAAPTAGGLLPPLDDPAASLGCAWVVEGSALGGRVLARHVESIVSTSVGAATTPGSSFFESGPLQAERWRACGHALEACGADPVRRGTILHAATATFAAFEASLANDA